MDENQINMMQEQQIAGLMNQVGMLQQEIEHLKMKMVRIETMLQMQQGRPMAGPVSGSVNEPPITGGGGPGGPHDRGHGWRR